jgi:predicted phosphodiesterase
MKRRSFLNTSLIAGLGISAKACQMGTTSEAKPEVRRSFSMDHNRINVFTHSAVTNTRIFHITDTHLSLNDDRGEVFQQYSSRMAGAYSVNTHFRTGEKADTKTHFEATLNLAKEKEADLIALTGDIFSFPSEAAIEWAHDQLQSIGIPYVYIAGNHDWHYEGMPGSSKMLREIWTQKRLTPLYQGNHPLYASYELNGLRIICIDNSTYEIEPEQLDFFKQHVKSGVPLLLMMHIPIYTLGRTLGYGCGHPEWGADTDRGFEVERREKWRAGGHTETTFQYCETAFSANNLLGIFAGHTHRPSLDVVSGIPQIVTSHNATGAYSDVLIKGI